MTLLNVWMANGFLQSIVNTFKMTKHWKIPIQLEIIQGILDKGAFGHFRFIMSYIILSIVQI